MIGNNKFTDNQTNNVMIQLYIAWYTQYLNFVYKCNTRKETTILKNTLSVIRLEHNLRFYYKHVLTPSYSTCKERGTKPLNDETTLFPTNRLDNRATILQRHTWLPRLAW